MMLSKTEQNIGAVISMFAITLLLTYISLPIFGFGNETTILSAIGVAFLSSVILCILVLRKYRKASQPFMIDYLNIGTQRYILALFMILYGIDKLLGNFFDYQLFALDSKLGDVSEFQLAWYFYGKNTWQELFTGIMEFVPALFLFRRQTYYIAAIVLLPVTAQVFLLNFFFKIGGITFPAATILLSCNIYILYSQKEKIILFFRSLNFNIIEPLTGTTKTVIRVLKRIAIILAVLVVFSKVRQAFFKSSYQKKYQELVGVYTLKEMKKNGSEYKPINESKYYKDLYIEKQDRWNILRRYNGQTDAFMLKLNTKNDSVRLYINKGGIGDAPDIIDTATVFKGIYKLQGKYLTFKGVQLKDTLDIVYEKQEGIKPKKWFW
jgi:ABC-type proline/glycine betaine transport system permease subunit